MQPSCCCQNNAATKTSRTSVPVREPKRNVRQNQELRKCMVPRGGIEPPTLRFSVSVASFSTVCSTLHHLKKPAIFDQIACWSFPQFAFQVATELQSEFS